MTLLPSPARNCARVGRRIQCALGAAAAFGYSRQLRKRIKRTPAAPGSSLPLA